MNTHPRLARAPRLRRALGLAAATALAVAGLSVGVSQAALAGTGPYTVRSTFEGVGDHASPAVGSDFDYYTGELWVAGYGAGTVTVVDPSTGVMPHVIRVGTQYANQGPLDIALDQSDGLAFATRPTMNDVAVMDDADYTLLGYIPVGAGPSGIAVDSYTNLVFVTNSSDNTVSIIDEASGDVNTVSVGTDPIAVAVDGTTGTAVVSNAGSGSISVIDEKSLSVTGTIPVPVGSSSLRALAVDEARGVVFAADNADKVYSFDEASGRLTAMVPFLGTGGSATPGLSVDPATGEAFLSAGELRPIDPGTYTEHAAVNCAGPIGASSHPLEASGPSIDPYNNIVYCVNQAATTITAIQEPISLSVSGPSVGDAGTVGQQFLAQFTARGPAPVSFVITDGAVPPGVTLDSQSGVLTGVPTSSGNYEWAITATDAGSDAVTQWFGWTVLPQVNRVYGDDRFATSSAIAGQLGGAKGGTVFIASGMNYPDGLSAGPAAAANHAPVLLTAPSVLPDSVATQVSQLAPSKIVVIGGTTAIQPGVVGQLQTLAPSATITRVAGDDRFATSIAVVNEGFTSADTVYVASGLNFPDALAAGGVAGAHGDPIILVNGGASTLDPSVADELAALGTTHIDVIGGTASISAALAAALGSYGTVTRLAGADRFATAEAVNMDGYTSASTVLLASAANFPDALSASSWAGQIGAPLFLSQGSCVPDDTLTDILDLHPSKLTVIGGSAALTESVAELTPC
ncbi:cell wall-binding repeat-containing protein [Gryllotalpicola protaetiae]|nr:cell wall-binding repeat-containing protein [Gryllotalpicola protaetiae]